MSCLKAQISLEYLFIILISSFVFFLIIGSVLGIEDIAKNKHLEANIRQKCEKIKDIEERLCYFGGKEKIYFDEVVYLEHKNRKLKIMFANKDVCEINDMCNLILQDNKIKCLKIDKQELLVFEKC